MLQTIHKILQVTSCKFATHASNKMQRLEVTSCTFATNASNNRQILQVTNCKFSTNASNKTQKLQVTSCTFATNASNNKQILQVTSCKCNSNASVKLGIYFTESTTLTAISYVVTSKHARLAFRNFKIDVKKSWLQCSKAANASIKYLQIVAKMLHILVIQML